MVWHGLLALLVLKMPLLRNSIKLQMLLAIDLELLSSDYTLQYTVEKNQYIIQKKIC